MIDGVFICPICGGELCLCERTEVCPEGHRFDLASSGYVNLLRPGKMRNRSSGDDKGMVLSRTRFLSSGYYENNRETLVSIVSRNLTGAGVIVDAGCGEGYYTNELAVRIPEAYVIGIDASKHACDAASKGAKRLGVSDRCTYAVASLSSQPIADGSVDVIVSLFSPCDYGEFARILKPGGRVVIGSAGRDHLYELKEILYGVGNVRENEPFFPEKRALGSGLSLLEKQELKYKTNVVGKENIASLFSMTPYYWRTPKSGSQALSFVDELSVRVEVDYTVLIKE